MNKFNHKTTQTVSLFITFTILFVLVTAGVYATENDIAPEPSPIYEQNCQIAGQLLVNTSPYGVLSLGWNEYIASINWEDYSDDVTSTCAATTIRKFKNSVKAEQLLENTPPVGRLEPHWNEYLASLNWADYPNIHIRFEQQLVPSTCTAC